MTITLRLIAGAGVAVEAVDRALEERMTVTMAAVATLSAFESFMDPFPTFALFSPRRAPRTRTLPAAHHPSRAGVVDGRRTYAACRAQVNNLKSEIKFPPRPRVQCATRAAHRRVGPPAGRGAAQTCDASARRHYVTSMT